MQTVEEGSVRLLASGDSWIDGAVVGQLYAAAKQEGVREVIAFPDVYPGADFAIGTAVLSEVIHPRLTGTDLGCGVGLWKTDLRRNSVDLGEWSEIRFDLEHPWEGDVARRLAKATLASSFAPREFGTLGGGSHFAEAQVVEKIYHRSRFKDLDLDREQVFVVVHSGSGSVAEAVLGSARDEPAQETFVAAQQIATRWAKASRALIAERFSRGVGGICERVLDVVHNSVTPYEECGEAFWLHRRGAAAANEGPILIPGSRGTLSYLVEAVDEGFGNGASIAHGCGRKWPRSLSRQKARERFGARGLIETELGGRVVCEERDLLYEEAPLAYKNIERVIRDLLEAGLVRVIASFRPVLTYKMREIRR